MPGPLARNDAGLGLALGLVVGALVCLLVMGGVLFWLASEGALAEPGEVQEQSYDPSA